MIQDTLASVASRVRACERTISSPSKRHAQVLLLDRQFLWIFSSTKFIILCIKTYFPALKHDERKEDTGAAFQSGVLNTNYFRSYTYTFSRRGHREEKKAKRTWKELASTFSRNNIQCVYVCTWNGSTQIRCMYIYFFFSAERARALKAIRISPPNDSYRNLTPWLINPGVDSPLAKW